MSDYIDILLSALEEEMYSYLGNDYFLSAPQLRGGAGRPVRHLHAPAAGAVPRL